MRKLFWQISTTLDGFMEGPDGELDDTAQVLDLDFETYAATMLAAIDDIVLGRVTYELFAAYWPGASGPDAARMNGLPKLVASRSLRELAWANARLAEDDVVAEVGRLKRRPGGDIAVFGSAALAATLLRAGLVDEIRMFVSPVILGRGHLALPGFGRRLRLRIEKVERWSSGLVALRYAVLGSEEGRGR